MSLLTWGYLAALLVLAGSARMWNWDQIFVPDGVHFVDADCYARMTRVQHIIQSPLRPIAHHDFENFPEGTTPHTTAPMDYAIAVPAWLIAPFVKNSVDIAGAFISPLLGVALVALLWGWARFLNLPYRHPMLLIVAVSPILVHGFLLGRPDHQSLVILLVGAALAVELTLWSHPSHVWDAVSGALWGFALWVSLFEPLILLVLVLLLRLILLRRPYSMPGGYKGPMILFGILIFVLLYEGWRGTGIRPGMGATMARWALDIGELRHTPPGAMFRWTGWLLVPVPFLLAWNGIRKKSRESIALLVLLIVMVCLTLWNQRSGYFTALIFALSLPWALPVIPRKSAVLTAFVISLWPIAQEWERLLFPDEKAKQTLAEDREDYQLLHQISASLVSPEQSAVLAPWWLSPPIAYWSGQPCVAGSSHQSLPGIVDTARFFLTGDLAEAKQILTKRRVKYVVAYEPSRILSNSQKILAEKATQKSLGYILYEQPYLAPDWLRLVAENKYYKVYEFSDPSM